MKLIVKRGLQGSRGLTGEAATETVILVNNLAKVITVADNIASVNTAANNVTAINTVATNIAAITTNNANSANINAVANVINNVNNAGNNIGSINAVAAALTPIGVVATNIASVNSAATNMPAIIAAPTEASAANTARIAAEAAASQAAANAASGLYRRVDSVTYGSSPLGPNASFDGVLFRVDTSAGNFVVNLAALSSYAKDTKFAFVKVTPDANTITINRGGTDLIEGVTSYVIYTQYEVNVLLGDLETGTWISVVQAADLADGSVTTNKLGNLQVTLAKLAANSVDSSKIVDGSIVAADLATDAISSIKIQALAVTTAKIADANVTTIKIADANVTLAKLAANSVDTSKIVDANVTNAKLAANAVTFDKIDQNAYSLSSLTPVNLADNGDFNILQRRETGTASGIWFADRWQWFHDGAGSFSVSVGALGVGSNASYYGLDKCVTLGQYGLTGQTFSYVSTKLKKELRTKAGRRLCVSWMNFGPAGTYQAEALQYFGTGGSPSGAVSTVANAALITTAPTGYGSSRMFAMIDVPAIDSKTMGTNVDGYLQINIKAPAGYNNTGWALMGLRVQEVTNTTTVPPMLVQEDFAEQATRCKQYFESSYDNGTNPGAAGASAGMVRTLANSTGSLIEGRIQFAVEKIKTPTVTLWNPTTGASGSIRDNSANADRTGMSAIDIGTKSANISGSGLTNGNSHVYYWTADTGY